MMKQTFIYCHVSSSLILLNKQNIMFFEVIFYNVHSCEVDNYTNFTVDLI